MDQLLGTPQEEYSQHQELKAELTETVDQLLGTPHLRHERARSVHSAGHRNSFIERYFRSLGVSIVWLAFSLESTRELYLPECALQAELLSKPRWIVVTRLTSMFTHCGFRCSATEIESHDSTGQVFQSHERSRRASGRR